SARAALTYATASSSRAATRYRRRAASGVRTTVTSTRPRATCARTRSRSSLSQAAYSRGAAIRMSRWRWLTPRTSTAMRAPGTSAEPVPKPVMECMSDLPSLDIPDRCRELRRGHRGRPDLADDDAGGVIGEDGGLFQSGARAERERAGRNPGAPPPAPPKHSARDGRDPPPRGPGAEEPHPVPPARDDPPLGVPALEQPRARRPQRVRVANLDPGRRRR